MSIEDGILAALPMLRAYANHLSRNGMMAEDLIQETVARAWANQKKFKQGTNLNAWLIVILRNEYFTHLRKRKREVEDPNGFLATTQTVADNQTGHQAAVEFLKAIELMQPKNAMALQLVGALGHSYDEAAAILGVPVGTIKSRVSRGRMELRKLVA